MSRNLIPLFIFILFFYSVVKSSCPICLEENDYCGTMYGICSYDTTCFRNSSLPSNQIRRCRKYLSEGDECGFGNLDDLCAYGTSCLKDKNNVKRCLYYGFATLGEDCELDTDCATNQLSCVKNKCTLEPSENCNGYNSNCNYDEYCLNDICKKIKFEGESCTSSGQCFGGLTCKNNVCFEKKLLILGADCSNGMCDYNENLYCSKNICVEFVEPKTKSCNPNATVDQCSYVQMCSCSDEECYRVSPSMPELDKSNYSDDLEKCAFDNECSASDSIIHTKSCVSKHCKKQLCYLTDRNIVKESDDCGKSAYYRDLYCSSSFKLTQSITSLFIILFFVFVITF
ncbi:hypothetical protein ACTFIY_008766 [Dictyostelium cf. discoideum]